MELKVSHEKNSIVENNQSFLNETGIYDVTIRVASLAKSESENSQAEQVIFNVEHGGNISTIYGTWVQKKNGTANEAGTKLLNRLAIIAAVKEGTDLSLETQTVNIGKDNKPTELEVITDFTDLTCKMRVQKCYSQYQGKIRGNLRLKAFYREDGASAEEIVNKLPIGVQLAKDEVYAQPDKITYENGLDKETVDKWIQDNKQSSNNGTETIVEDKPKSSLFDKK